MSEFVVHIEQVVIEGDLAGFRDAPMDSDPVTRELHRLCLDTPPSTGAAGAQAGPEKVSLILGEGVSPARALASAVYHRLPIR